MGRVVGDAEGDFADFRSIGIIGLGLIGGSLALAIRERWPEAAIVGVDRPEVLAEAVTRGIITRGAPRAGALATQEDVDLVVLAAPVLQNIACLRELQAATKRPLLVMDVGSTKLSIVDASRDDSYQTRNDRHQYLTFVGGHPIAGTAHAGLAHARADLFRGRAWVFTPSPGDDPAPIARLNAFVRAIGAEPSTLDPAEHDRVMAYVSHLPQLAASALMRVAGEGVGPAGFAMSGAGLYDTTRLASSPASMWTDILKSNAEHVGRALDAFIADLQAIRAALTSSAAGEWLEAGARWRSQLASNTNGAANPHDPANRLD